MQHETELDPMDLPFDLGSDIGIIKAASLECPGVYYIAASRGPFLVADEYYVVDDDTSMISQTAKRYGRRSQESPRFLLYDRNDKSSGCGIIDYEVAKYRYQHNISDPSGSTLHDIAIYNMEHNPEYFGTYPAPTCTPYGYTTRYHALMKGVFWIETDQCKEALAVCYPMWNGDLSDGVMELGIPAEGDAQAGMDIALGYLFFNQTAGSLALFELWQLYDSLRDSGYIDYPALMNYIWKYAPEYAAAHNLNNQFGLNDTLGLLLNSLGDERELQSFPEDNIMISEGAGLRFLKIWE